MGEPYKIFDYLPQFFREPSEEEYIKFLWEAYESNYASGKFQFAFMAYHMLFMSFVYFNIWKIKLVRSEDFEKIRLGFGDPFETAPSPFGFSQENESKVFDLLRYLCMSHPEPKAVIGKYKALVRERNDIAHANGNMSFRTESYLETKVNDILRFAEEIQGFSKPVILECFERFLLDSQDEELREYMDISNQIKEVLIHRHYLSPRDIAICLEYDHTRLSDNPGFEEIGRIYGQFVTEYYQDSE